MVIGFIKMEIPSGFTDTSVMLPNKGICAGGPGTISHRRIN